MERPKQRLNGGTVCFIEGNAAADNILRRASGTRDSLSGKKGLDRLAGEGGWTEIAGCPVFTNDDGAKGVQAMADILAANPKLDAFVLEGGWPLFDAPQPYRQLTDQRGRHAHGARREMGKRRRWRTSS
jgi:ribose transport system substrate-binding protein